MHGTDPVVWSDELASFARVGKTHTTVELESNRRPFGAQVSSTTRVLLLLMTQHANWTKQTGYNVLTKTSLAHRSARSTPRT